MILKALIIESTGYYRSLLHKILADIGLECDVYSSGKEALEVDKNTEYAFILLPRYLDDMSGELFLHLYRESHPIGDALTIMITSDEVSKVVQDANKAGFKLVFNKKDIDSIQAFLISVLNNRTLNLKGNILYVEDQKSIAAATTALFESYQANV